jgi:hypothetical protein
MVEVNTPIAPRRSDTPARSDRDDGDPNGHGDQRLFSPS